jgi:hypothetical protein
MVYLQDSEKASGLLELDKGSVRRLSAARSLLLKKAAARTVSGHFGYIEGRPAAMYRAGGRLWMAIDGKPWFLDELTAGVHRVGEGVRVEIAAPDHRYRFNVDALDPDPDLGFEDAEDFSFGLWAANVMNSPERQHVLLETLVDAPIDQVPDHAEIDSLPSLDLKKSWLGQGGQSDAQRRGSAG